MKILVDEECGWKMWLWVPQQQTSEALIQHWLSMRSKFEDMSVYSDLTILGGSWTEIDCDEWGVLSEDSECGGSAHVNQVSDSCLNLSGRIIRFS